MRKMFLMVALAISSVMSWGAKYTLVTSTDDLSSGDKVVVSCSKKSVVAGALDGTKMPSVTATFADDKSYVTVTGAYEYTITQMGSYWVLSNDNGYIGCTSNKNSLTTNSGADKYSSNWVIESITSGDVKYLCKSNSYKNTWLQYNSSAKYFSNYDSNQTAIQFYKKVVSEDPVIECVEEINFGLVLVHDGVGVAEEQLDVDVQNLTEAISVSLTSGSDNFTIDATSIPSTGGSVKVGFLADANGTYTGTLLLQSGSASATVTLTAEALVVNGAGTQEEPLTCGDVVAMNFNDANAKGWVMGYILGSAATGPAVAGTANNTSLILADNAEGLNKIAVALPDNAVRADLNVVEHPENIGKRVKVYGSLEKYFGGPGVKSTSQYEWVDGNPEAIEDVLESTLVPQKILREGQVVILRNGVIYDMTGKEVR